MADYRFI